MLSKPKRIVRFLFVLSLLLMASWVFAQANFSAISGGNKHTCAINNGLAECWGSNSNGQLGNGSGSGESSLIPVRVKGFIDVGGVTSISAGRFHSCAIYQGSAYCWGSNAHGRLGNSPAGGMSATPLMINELGVGVNSVVAGNEHTCAIINGAAWCWGRDRMTFGQLGDGGAATDSESSVPVAVLNLTSGVTSIAAKWSHTCAIQNGAVWCWGRGTEGQLGNSSNANSHVPVQVRTSEANLTGATAIAAGVKVSCAIYGSNNALVCWGDNSFNQVSDGEVGAAITQAIPIAGLTAVEGVEVGGQHTCAIFDASSNGYCWGRDTQGQLGNGSGVTDSVPTAASPVMGLATGVMEITAGNNHSCAIQQDGRAYCWGSNVDGQLGDGTREARHQAMAVLVRPDAPTMLRSTAVTKNSITVEWGVSANDGGALITTYRVSWSRGGINVGNIELTFPTTSHKIDQLESGNLYKIEVFATNSLGEGSPGVLEQRTYTVPDAPTTLKSIAVTDDSITVEWDAPADNGGTPITAYEVSWRSIDDSVSMSDTELVISPATSYRIGQQSSPEHQALEPGVLYKINVLAINSVDRGPRAEPPLQQRTNARVPDAPTALRSIAVTDDSITVEWDVPASDGGTPITAYEVSWRSILMIVFL